MTAVLEPMTTTALLPSETRIRVVPQRRQPGITDAVLTTGEYNRALTRSARDPRSLMGM
jgi:hypothetical protein